jgi:hypothetical protein
VRPLSKVYSLTKLDESIKEKDEDFSEQDISFNVVEEDFKNDAKILKKKTGNF